MKLKDTFDKDGEIIYGDLTGQVYKDDITVQIKVNSLEGCPKECHDFDATATYIKNLEYGPEKVNGCFSVSHCKGLESLKGAPKFIAEEFYCEGTYITDEEITRQIIEYQIKANHYYLGKTDFAFKEIEKEFRLKQVDVTVKSKGFRTLLGLKK